MATRKLPPRLGVSAAVLPSERKDRPSPTAPTMTSRRLMPERDSPSSFAVMYLSIEEPRAVLAKFDQRGAIGGERVPRRSDQMLGAHGTQCVATNPLGDPDEIGTFGLDADARHSALFHLIDD